MEKRPCSIKYINLHHTAGHEKNTATIRAEHMNNPNKRYGDIGYNAVIEPSGAVGSITNSDGETAHGRNIKWSGAHNPGLAPDGSGYTMNQRAYAISHIGNFENETFPDVMFDGSTKFCAQMCKELGIVPSRDTIRRHSDDYATACPGKNFPYEKYVARVIELYKGGNDVANNVIAFWSAKDYSAAVQISERLNNCLMTCRNAKPDLNPDAKAAKHLIVVGGPEVTDHLNVTNLCGATGPDTAILAANYAKGL